MVNSWEKVHGGTHFVAVDDIGCADIRREHRVACV
jgi:hypothetical protein